MEDSTKNATLKNKQITISEHTKWKEKHIVQNPILCGIGAGWTNIFITFPINKFSFRQQVESTNPQRAWLNLKAYFSQHGSIKNILYTYRGCSIPLVQKALANSIMYGSYSSSRNYIGNNFENLSTDHARGLACLTAGSIEAVLCTPLERCQSVLQDRRHDSKFRGLKDVLVWHYSRRSYSVGLRSLYTGGGLIVLRNSITTFNYFAIRDWYKNNSDRVMKDKWYKHAVFGMLSGAIGCTISYPINTVKNKIQTNLSPKSVVSTIKVTYSKNAKDGKNEILNLIEIIQTQNSK